MDQPSPQPIPAPIQPSPPGGSVPSPIPGPIALLKESWAQYKQKYKTYLAIMVVMLGSILVPTGIFMYAFLKTIPPTTPGTMPNIPVETLIVFMLFYVFFVFIAQIIAGVGYIGMVYATKDPGATWKSSYKMGWKYLWPYMWIATLVMLVIFGGFILFVIPGIFLTIWFSQSLFVLVDDDKRGMDALLLSKEYVNNRFLSVLWRLIAFTLIMFAIMLPFLLVLAALQVAEAPETLIQSVNIIVNIIYTLIFAPVSVIYLYKLYLHLKQARGTFTFEPTRKQKVPYILLAVLSLLWPVIMAATAAFTIVPLITSLYGTNPQGELKNGMFPGMPVNQEYNNYNFDQFDTTDLNP